MGRNTIKSVRTKVNWLDSQCKQNLEFQAWGSGQTRYQLMDADTGKTYSGVCIGASEFMSALKAFEYGMNL